MPLSGVLATAYPPDQNRVTSSLPQSSVSLFDDHVVVPSGLYPPNAYTNATSSIFPPMSPSRFKLGDS